MEGGATGFNWRGQALPSRCVGEICFWRLIGGRGFAGGLLPHLDVFSGLLCKSLIINAIDLQKSFCMDSQCPSGSAMITARLANWAKREEETWRHCD
jgi:hypothetical protein